MTTISTTSAALLLSILLASCATHEHHDAATHSHAAVHPILAGGLFKGVGITVAPELVACVLSGGTQSTCISVTVKAGADIGHAAGPWCPVHVSDGPDKAGIWLEGGKVFDADGQFIKNLATFYKDDQWQMFNPVTGQVKVTDSKEACLAAARPDVDPKYKNYCVQCLPSYVDAATESTYLIPAEPKLLEGTQRFDPRSGMGLAFNGVRFDAPAPVDAILGAHTVAPFDDCGGHVNPHVGYHYHAVTGCAPAASAVSASGHAPWIGYAMDGFKLFGRLNADGSKPGDLDTCGGHQVAGVGYHYHVNEPGKNQILGCFRAEQGCVLSEGKKTCDVGRRPPPPPKQG